MRVKNPFLHISKQNPSFVALGWETTSMWTLSVDSSISFWWRWTFWLSTCR